MNRIKIPATITILAAAFAAAASGALPETLSLDGEWAFKWAADEREADALRWFHEEGFDLSGFTTIPVPSNWTTHGFEEPHYVDGTRSEGFYLRSFDVPAGADGLRALLHFGGVWVSAEVWLNGVALGRHDSGFTAFGYDVSQWLKPGGENVLAVRVRQQIGGNLFKYDANDDWGLPGIYRSVWLEFTPAHLFIERVEVDTVFDDLFIDADLNIRAHVFRRESGHFRDPSPPFDVRAILRTRDGAEVARKAVTVTIGGANNGRDVRMRVPVRAPLQWTAETPHLYEVEVQLERDGQLIHSWRDLVGFRQISTAGGVFRINGQVVKLRGVNRHDQHPDVGRATRPGHWEEDIRLMKEANINAVRMAHYPHAEGFVRLCDEMGLYVLGEIPLGFGGNRFGKPIFAGGMYLRLHGTVKRDRNRPSVIAWGFGNEDPLRALHVDGIRALKGLDPSRPVLLPFRAEIETPPEVDILAPHYWFTEEYDQLGAVSTRPVISTEYTHALGSEGFGELEDRWTALTRHPAGAGAFIWLFNDQGLRRSIDGAEVLHPLDDKDRYTRGGSELVRHSDAGPGEIYDAHGHYGTDGIVNPDRTPQRSYWETRAVYAPVRFPVKRLAFQPGAREVRVPVRNEHDFLDLSAVSISWRLLRDQTELAAGTLRAEAPPRTGAMLVIPVDAIPASPQPGVHHLQFTVLRADGSEMTRQAVRLGFEPAPQPAGPAAAAPPRARTGGGVLTVTAGPAQYAFDTRSGELSGISLGGKVLVDGMDLVVWRPATFAERNRYDRRDNQHDWNTYMQGLDPVLHAFDVREADDAVEVRVRNEYRADGLNGVVAELVYRISNTGILRVALTVRPEMDIPELPEIGIELHAAPGAARLAWLGQGPIDSLPGMDSATRFGCWSAALGEPHAFGSKHGIEWARLGFDNGAGLHVKDAAGVRVVQRDGAAPAFRVLTHLAGAWTKNGPAERPEWHLDLERNESFSGLFEVIPVQH